MAKSKSLPKFQPKKATPNTRSAPPPPNRRGEPFARATRDVTRRPGPVGTPPPEETPQPTTVPVWQPPRPPAQSQSRPGPARAERPPVSTYAFDNGTVEQAPYAVGPVEARAPSQYRGMPTFGSRPGARVRPNYVAPTYLEQMAGDYAAGVDWERPYDDFNVINAPPLPVYGPQPATGAQMPPRWFTGPATYDQYGMPIYQGGGMTANPYYQGEDYALRHPELARGVKEGATRGSGKPPGQGGKQPGPWPRPPAQTFPSGYDGGGGDGGGYDGGGGYGGGGGGGFGDRPLPDWYYGMVTWRF